jgi:hypothetical protein
MFANLFVFFALLAIAPTASNADAAVLKNKQTGETISGTLTDQKINGKRLFKLEDGSTKLIESAEWETIQADAAPGAAGTSPSRTGSAPKRKAYLFPLTSPINYHAMVEALDRGINEAKTLNAAVIIIRVDTPGGQVELADKIMQLIANVNWAPVVVCVDTGHKRALSAGAYICLAASKIYMAPGATIGAATPFLKKSTGEVQVDAKLTSAFRARFRSLAQLHGYPSALVDAMVDADVSVVQVFVNGKQMLVTEDEANRLESQYKTVGQFHRGKVVNKRGEPITLTSDEAVTYGICASVISSPTEILKQMNLCDCEIVEPQWVATWIQQQTKARKATVDSLLTTLQASLAKAELYRFGAQSVAGVKATNTAQVTAVMLQLLKEEVQKARKALASLEKLAADERYDIDASTEELAQARRQMDVYIALLKTLAP